MATPRYELGKSHWRKSGQSHVSCATCCSATSTQERDRLDCSISSNHIEDLTPGFLDMEILCHKACPFLNFPMEFDGAYLEKMMFQSGSGQGGCDCHPHHW